MCLDYVLERSHSFFFQIFIQSEESLISSTYTSTKEEIVLRREQAIYTRQKQYEMVKMAWTWSVSHKS